MPPARQESGEPPDATLAAFVAGRDGIVTTAELRALGFGDGAIEYRSRIGRLHRLHPGVYAVGHRTVTDRGRWRAAVAACGPRALLSHRSAARLWGLPARLGPGVEVTVRHGTRRRRGIRMHRSRSLRAKDAAEVRGIPVTGVSRTLLDLAGVLSAGELERAVVEAERRRLLDVTDVLGLCGTGHRGSCTLGAIIVRELAPAAGTDSELELRFLDVCRRFSIPLPRTNMTVEGLRVDAYWPDACLVVELDGHAFHRTPGDQRRDAARDRKLVLAGNRVLRFGWLDVTEGAQMCADAVLAALASASGPHNP